MATKKQTYWLLIAMLLLHSVWLLVKGKIGTLEDRANAIHLLYFTIPLGVLYILVPVVLGGRARERIHQFLKRLGLDKTGWAVAIFLLGIAAIDQLLIPHVADGGDESSLIRAARIIVESGAGYFFENYGEVDWLGRQHPPLPALAIAYAGPLFGGDLLWASRTLASFLGIGTALCTYLVAKQLYGGRVALYSVAALYGLRKFFLNHILSGNDNYVIFFFALSVLLLLQISNAKSSSNFQWISLAVAAGVSISLGVLSKYTMALAFIIPPALLLWPFRKTIPPFQNRVAPPITLKRGWLLLAVIGIGALPLMVVWFRFLYHSDYFFYQFSFLSSYLGAEVDWTPTTESVTVKESDYLNHWRLTFTLEAIVRKIPTAIGLYNLPLIALGAWAWTTKGKLAWSNLFIAFWLLVVFVPVLLMLPVDRYLMPAFPALAVLIANGVNVRLKEPVPVLVMALGLSISSALVFVH